MSIPVYVPQDGGTTTSWPEDPPPTLGLWRQYGGRTTFGRRAGALFHRVVRPKLQEATSTLAKASAQSLSNVAEDVMKGKDLKEALTDEATASKIDLKRKMEETAHKALGTMRSLDGTRPPPKKRKTAQTNRRIMNTLFDD